jgi:hypothetical protein
MDNSTVLGAFFHDKPKSRFQMIVCPEDIGLYLFIFNFVEILSIQNGQNACYNSESLVNIILYAKKIRNSKIQ